jgi:alpha-ketoglutaric semialdehyde dehydrogenase
LLFYEGYEVGLALVRHPLVMAGAFTGSRSGGIALWRAAQERPVPIPFFAEMSSVNPIFVFPGASGAHAELLAKGLHASVTGGVGQFCTKPGLVFVIKDAAAERWLGSLAVLMSQSTPARMLTPAIHSSCRRAIDERGAVEGVGMLAQVAMPAGATDAGAALLAVDVDTFLSTPSLRDEIFGPTSLIVYCSAPEDFLRCAQALEGQLTATVWAGPDELRGADELLFTLEQKAGRLVFNGFPTGVEVGAAIVHGGPFPATTDSRFTSVGTRAFMRFVRPVAHQGQPF